MISLFALILLLAILLTGCLRAYALKRSLMDIPNHRSSHTVPVPRGGGLSIVILVLSSVLIARLTGHIDSELFYALFVGGGVIALIGWIDDHRDLSAGFRALMQLLVAVWVVFWLGDMDTLQLGEFQLNLGLFGSFLAVIAVIWLVNLYNFMDGTDGIASVQALTAAVAGMWFFLQGNDLAGAGLCLVLIGSTTGFLIWNWSPASIFMGDVGSSFIGYLFAVLALYGEQSGTVPVMIWIILLGGFISDASLTLVKRMLKGEKWYSAHRSHAYQRIVQMGASHAQLALGFLFLNIILLWPLAYWAFVGQMMIIPVILSLITCSLIWFVIQKRYDQQ